MKRSKFLQALLMIPFIGTGLQAAVPKKKWIRQWLPEDIKGGIFITLAKDVSKNPGYALTVTYQIGFSHHFSAMEYLYKNRPAGYLQNKIHNSQYTLNSLADGWSHGNVARLKNHTIIGYNKQELADYLNLNGYRPATQEEIIEIIKYSTKNFLS